jgi:DNA-binding MarR family transcriptional regulator
MTRPEDCLYYLISRASLVATSMLKQEFAAAGVSGVRPAYLGVLLSLWKEDGPQAAELGRRAGLEPSSMTGLLDRMERDELIRREADPNDRRAQRIHLTRAGKRAEKPVVRIVDAMLAKLTGGIAKTKLDTTKTTLQRVLELARRPS